MRSRNHKFNRIRRRIRRNRDTQTRKPWEGEEKEADTQTEGSSIPDSFLQVLR